MRDTGDIAVTEQLGAPVVHSGIEVSIALDAMSCTTRN
jgi:hypothetical protein